MNISKRIRVVTFRVSDEEYTNLRSMYPAAGARSVSELARSAIERLLSESHNGNGHPCLATRVEELDFRVARLDRELARLNRAIAETVNE